MAVFPGKRRRGAVLAPLALGGGLLFLAAAAPALAQGAPAGPQIRLGAPQRLTPAPPPPAPVAAGPSATPARPIEASPLAPIDPDWSGPLTDGQGGGFPATLWQGTPRALVAALVPRLPAASTSPALRALTRRLLLSNAVAPEGKSAGEATDLAALRAQHLIAAGRLEDADALLRLLASRSETEATARLRVERAFLAGDDKTACERVGEDVRRFQGVWWSRALVTCQALAGDHGKAALGLDLLREQKAPRDDAFDALAAALGGRKGKIERLADPTPLHLALFAAAKLPLPADALAAAPPAALRRWAAAEGAPPAQRLAAAERAALFGAIPIEQLRTLYEATEFTAEERAAALTKAAAEKGGRAHALLYAAARAQPAPAGRAEILQALLAQARKDGDLPLVARIAEPMLLELKPADELGWFAGEAARALLLLGRAGEARAWMAVADPAATAPVAVARLALGRDGPPLEGQALTRIVTALAKEGGEDGARRAALMLALLSGFDDPVGPADWAVLADKLPLTSLDLPGSPIWFELPRAAAAKRLGETVLLALVTLGEGERLSPQPARLVPALAALRAVGLEGEARALAVEAAVAAGL